MQKFNLSVDVLKIQKNRLRENKYTNKEGQEVKQMFCDIVGVPLNEKKLIKSGEGWAMYKTGFAVEKGTKEETTNILGDIIEFEDTKIRAEHDATVDSQIKSGEISPDEIPF